MTLKVDVVENTSGGPVTLTSQEAAKARCKWNGTGTIAIADSYNVSSLDDNATGQYDVNYTSSFSSGDYSCLTSGAGGSGTSGPYDITEQVAGYVNIRYYAGGYFDANTCNMANIGDLA